MQHQAYHRPFTVSRSQKNYAKKSKRSHHLPPQMLRVFENAISIICTMSAYHFKGSQELTSSMRLVIWLQSKLKITATPRLQGANKKIREALTSAKTVPNNHFPEAFFFQPSGWHPLAATSSDNGVAGVFSGPSLGF